MRNELIEKLLKEAIAGSNKLCRQHGEDIATLKSGQQEQKEDIKEIKAFNASLLVKLDNINDQLLIFKTQRNMVVSAICAVGSIGGLIIGASLEYITRKFGGFIWLI